MPEINRPVFDRRKLITGGLLVLVGILTPLLLPAETLHIVDLLILSIREQQSGYLMETSLLLVLLNTLRCLPHYLGTFLIIQGIKLPRRIPNLAKNILLTAFIISAVYRLISLIYGIYYDFGVPAMLMISVVIAVNRLDFRLVSIVKEILMLTMLIICIQFLDVFPDLPESWFGGELATEIKQAAEFMGAQGLLKKMCLMFIGIFGSASLILGLQISLENQLRKARRVLEEDKEQLISTRMKLLDARASKEQQFLVHDLKAPLTSIQLWSDLLKMKYEGCGCSECGEYLQHIDSSLSHMNMLISELMNSRSKNVYHVKDVVKLFSSQTSPSGYSRQLDIRSDCDELMMKVNRTNLVRALINLTDNASKAVDPDKGEIALRVFQEGVNVCFSVSDNGEGIPPKLLDRIWEKGVSGRGSTGVGLFFVKEVATELEGSVSIESTPGKGTEVRLLIPVYRDN